MACIPLTTVPALLREDLEGHIPNSSEPLHCWWASVFQTLMAKTKRLTSFCWDDFSRPRDLSEVANWQNYKMLNRYFLFLQHDSVCFRLVRFVCWFVALLYYIYTPACISRNFGFTGMADIWRFFASINGNLVHGWWHRVVAPFAKFSHNICPCSTQFHSKLWWQKQLNTWCFRYLSHFSIFHDQYYATAVEIQVARDSPWVFCTVKAFSGNRRWLFFYLMLYDLRFSVLLSKLFNSFLPEWASRRAPVVTNDPSGNPESSAFWDSWRLMRFTR